jgi:hypothetical protein
MKTIGCRVLVLVSSINLAVTLPWKPDIAAGGSVSPLQSSKGSLFHRSTLSAPPSDQDEALFVVKRDGRRELFNQDKVS